MKRIVTVVAAVIVSLKGLTIPRTKKEIPFTGRFDREYTYQIKGPPWRAFFNLLISRPSPAGSRVLRGLREKALADIVRSLNGSRGSGRFR
jgi:hypothetical protein